jgi:hypothetical protein
MKLSPGVPFLLTAALLVSAVGSGAASVYRCHGADGVEYADKPCGDNAQILELDDSRLGGTLTEGQPLPAPTVSAPETEPPPTARQEVSPCRDFQSTNLHSYLIREQVVRGMTRAHVRKAWGAPVEAYAGPEEMWAYDNTYYGRLLSVTRVYFKDGCVTEVETIDP